MKRPKLNYKADLPYGWRKTVAQNLRNKGITLNVQQISEVIRQRIVDINLTENVYREIHDLSIKHRAAKNRIYKLRSKIIKK